jgi:hypothetical protein
MKFQLMKNAAKGVDVPMAVFDNLNDKSAADLQVILYVIKQGFVDIDIIKKTFGLSESAVNSALLKWVDSGLIGIVEEDKQESINLDAKSVLEFSKTNAEISTLVNGLQFVFGAPINERQTLKFVSIFLESGAPVGVILLLAKYYAPLKKSPAYTARVLQNLIEKEEINTLEKAEYHVKTKEKQEELVKNVCDIFNIEVEKVTTSEKSMIVSWDEKLDMSLDMVKTAKSVAGDSAGIRYCNGILKSWSAKGYKSPRDIEEYPESSGAVKIDKDFEKAKKVIDRRRMSAVSLVEKRKKEINSKIPYFQNLENEISVLNADKAMRQLTGNKNDVTKLDLKLKEKSKKRKDILAKLGYTENDLQPKYHCKECKDTGYLNGRVCHCLKEEVDKIRKSSKSEK